MEKTTYAQRLSRVIETTEGMNQSRLAEMIGTAPQTIQRLCKSGQSSKYTTQIAKALQISPTWLATGEGPMRETAKQQTLTKNCPIYNWSDLYAACTGGTAEPIGHMIVEAKHGDAIAASVISGTSMAKWAPPGYVAVFNYSKEAIAQAISNAEKAAPVNLVLCSANNDILLRHLFQDGNKLFIQPSSPDFPLIALENPQEAIIGALALVQFDSKA